MPRTGIALGSNAGDRLSHMRAACARLREIATPGEAVLVSPIYQTEPVSCPPGSPVFYNAVIEIHFSGTAPDLLDITRAMEKQLGRIPAAERNAPRVIDIDILYHGETSVNTGTLVIPHPRISGRRFVLQPLADIRPSLVLPGQDQSMKHLSDHLQSDEPPLVRIHECL